MKTWQPSVIVITANMHQSMRDMLLGVLDYAREHGPWIIYPVTRQRWDKSQGSWQGLRADGIVTAATHTAAEARRLTATGLPLAVLNVPHEMYAAPHPFASCSRCLWDSEACGRMAARSFLERDYRHFAFVDFTNSQAYWSLARERGYRMSLQDETDVTYHRYGHVSPRERDSWIVERPRLVAWLNTLPKPCAVFVANDRRAQQVMDACRVAELPVPGEIAILGVDNEEWFCNASVPTISSIRCDTRMAGRLIAEHLDRRMRGETTETVDIPVHPIEIVTRQSTDWTAVEDDKVAIALRYLAEHFTDPRFTIARLVRATGLARCSIERRFRNVTGHTLHEELDRLRRSRLKTLLAEGHIPRPRLAQLAGYKSLTVLNRALRAGLP